MPYQTANASEEAHASGNKYHLVRALEKPKLFFTIQGVMTLMVLILGAIFGSMGMLGAMLDVVS